LTLVFGVATAESIWLLADRRLTRGNKTYRDDSIKMVVLDALDGVALLGYAGLGETPGGTEPSEWMSRVLRGRRLAVERSLEVLAGAASEQLPKHLKESGHVIASVAIVDGQPRVYTIEVGPKPGQLLCRRLVYKSGWPPPFICVGTGEVYLRRHLDESRQRDLLRLVKACNKGKVSPLAVCDYLAWLNYEASIFVSTVGADCVAMSRFNMSRFKAGSPRQRLGNALVAYVGTQRTTTPNLPTISRGMDMKAMGEIFGKQFEDGIAAYHAGTASSPFERVDPGRALAEFDKLPWQPDEGLN
jgi:hypothetical protein